MDAIQRQVRVARRRLITQRFLAIAGWSLLATLLLGAIGLAIPKIWVLPVASDVWMWSWLGGAVGAGLLVAGITTYLVRGTRLEAAIEIDRRFHLKERVSSALSLPPDEADSEIGRALVQDAVRRVERIDVRESFPVSAGWRPLLPLLPAAAIFALVYFVDDAVPEKQVQAAPTVPLEAKKIANSTKELRKRLAEAEKKAQDKGLEDANELLKELQKGLEDLANKEQVERKDALVKLNDLSKNIEKRREQLGGADQVRQQFNRLKDLQPGPGDKIADALKKGDFQKAMDELKNLQDKLKDNQLNDEEKKQLAEQVKQLADKLQQLADAHEQAKRDLQDEIKKKLAAGDNEAAGKLQRQLDQMNQMNDAMDRLKQLADKMGQCQKCLENGDAKQAAAELAEMAQDLQDLQQQLDELETLDQALQEIAAAKDAMNCQKCNGEGCEACLGDMFGQNQGRGQGNGMGLGEGQGRGERPEERTDTSHYESQVRSKIQPGASVVTGTAGGPNRAGVSLENAKDQMLSDRSQDADPLIEVRLPRKERDHAREYFQQLNKGG